jgi:hypothetical protein
MIAKASNTFHARGEEAASMVDIPEILGVLGIGCCPGPNIKDPIPET